MGQRAPSPGLTTSRHRMSPSCAVASSVPSLTTRSGRNIRSGAGPAKQTPKRASRGSMAPA